LAKNIAQMFVFAHSTHTPSCCLIISENGALTLFLICSVGPQLIHNWI